MFQHCFVLHCLIVDATCGCGDVEDYIQQVFHEKMETDARHWELEELPYSTNGNREFSFSRVGGAGNFHVFVVGEWENGNPE